MRAKLLSRLVEGSGDKALLQLVRFALVGVLSTVIHVALYVILVSMGGWLPLWANVAAFVVASFGGYCGHGAWTFSVPVEKSWGSRGSRFGKYIISAVFGLLMNSFFVFVVTTVLEAGYLCAVPLMVLVTPVTIFAVNKYWVFDRSIE